MDRRYEINYKRIFNRPNKEELLRIGHITCRMKNNNEIKITAFFNGTNGVKRRTEDKLEVFADIRK